MAQRFEGRNLEEAIAVASAELGVESFRLKYHVLTEKRGFLGGVKKIAIEAEIDSAAREEKQAAREVELPELPPAVAVPQRRAAELPLRAPRERQRRGGRGRNQDGPAAPPQARRPRSVEIPDQEQRSAFADQVVAWCTELTALADFDVVLRTVESEESLGLRIYGRDAELFTERNGELLDAIQTIVNKAFSDSTKPTELDALDFKKERADGLSVRARELADQVRRDGREQTLPAMSPVERRIIHLALSADPDVTTESRGEGYFKRVTILRRSAPSAPES